MKYFKLLTITLFFLIVGKVNSQIVYTDIEPDTTVSEFLNGYGLDFNDDNKIDIHITLLSNYGVWVMHLIPDSEVDNTYVLYDGEEASVLEDGDNISASSNWYKLGSGWGGLLYGYWESSGEYGNWTDLQEDKYLGIKFEIGNDFHYAWIKLTTEVFAIDDFEFTVQSYAYNSVTGEEIAAGDTGDPNAIICTENNPVSLFPNPAINEINIQLTNEINKITISDINGKEMYSSNYLASMNESINVSDFASGIYIVRVETDEGVNLSKFMKQ